MYLTFCFEIPFIIFELYFYVRYSYYLPISDESFLTMLHSTSRSSCSTTYMDSLNFSTLNSLFFGWTSSLISPNRRKKDDSEYTFFFHSGEMLYNFKKNFDISKFFMLYKIVCNFTKFSYLNRPHRRKYHNLQTLLLQ